MCAFVDNAKHEGDKHMALARHSIDTGTYTEDEYLALEDAARHKSEWIGGEMRAMAGATEAHILVAANTVAALGNVIVLQGCRVYGSDMKVHTGSGANVYPDASAVCGPREFYMGRTSVVVNPQVVVEVLSPFTQDADRGEKWTQYQSVASLREYLLLAQDTPAAWLYARDGDGWRFQAAQGMDAEIVLPSVGATVTLADVYALVEWPAG